MGGEEKEEGKVSFMMASELEEQADAST